jgi:dethiobiotin synthetase
MSFRGVFVAGTDTGVGKTEIARALLHLFAREGLRPRALKPVETGCAPDAPEDALALRAACGPPGDALALDRVCPYRFRMPAAPLVAAEAEGRAVNLEVLLAVAKASAAEGPLVVEAAGGLYVPLAREVAQASLEQADDATAPPAELLATNLDLAERLGLPVLLVGRAGLGTINHCALSAGALERRGLTVLAVVLDHTTAPADDPTLATNARMIAELTGLPVLGPLPFVADAAARPAALSALLEPVLLRLSGARAPSAAPAHSSRPVTPGPRALGAGRDAPLPQGVDTRGPGQ